MNNEIIYQMKGKSYIEVFLISGNHIIDRVYSEDIGQRWLISKKTNKAFLLPDRSEALHIGKKSLFFYSADNALPLAFGDIADINEQDSEYIYGIDAENKLIRMKNRIFKSPDKLINPAGTDIQKIKPSKIQPTTIDSTALQSVMNNKVIADLLKPTESPFEALKMPLLALIGVIGIIALIYLI